MQIKTLLQQVNPDTFIENYLKANGIEDINLYLKPNKSCLDNVEDYVNIDKGFKLLKEIIENEREVMSNTVKNNYKYIVIIQDSD